MSGSSQPCHFPSLARAPSLQQRDGLVTTVLTGVSGEAMMMALNVTLPGHSVPVHTHPHEQVGMVYRGRGLLSIAGEERLVEFGDFYCIPANVEHGDTCMGDEPFVMLDVFCPVREDLIAGLRQESGEPRESERPSGP